MRLVQIAYLVAWIAAGVIVAAMRRRGGGPTRRMLLWSLTALILSLLAVGVVSHSFLRHIVQAVPPAIALVLVAARPQLGPPAAAPILTFWFGVMVNIWMFLLGLASVFTGTFTPIEIALTMAIAAACAIGVAGVMRAGSPLSVGTCVVIAAVFGVGQIVAMIVSFRFR